MNLAVLMSDNTPPGIHRVFEWNLVIHVLPGGLASSCLQLTGFPNLIVRGLGGHAHTLNGHP